MINEVASFEKEHFAFEPANFEWVVQEIFAFDPTKSSQTLYQQTF